MYLDSNLIHIFQKVLQGRKREQKESSLGPHDILFFS